MAPRTGVGRLPSNLIGFLSIEQSGSLKALETLRIEPPQSPRTASGTCVLEDSDCPPLFSVIRLHDEYSPRAVWCHLNAFEFQI